LSLLLSLIALTSVHIGASIYAIAMHYNEGLEEYAVKLGAYYNMEVIPGE
jgi:hypothetical protein